MVMTTNAADSADEPAETQGWTPVNTTRPRREVVKRQEWTAFNTPRPRRAAAVEMQARLQQMHAAQAAEDADLGLRRPTASDDDDDDGSEYRSDGDGEPDDTEDDSDC